MAEPGVEGMREICKHGDLVLVVGPEKLKLQVLSGVLRNSSRVFDAMLGPNWKEGGAAKVGLPEDNGIAMRHICLALHCRLPIPLETLDSNTLLKIAALSDKYFLNEALFYAAKFWLEQSTSDPHALMELTTAAYLFRNANAFKTLTKELVLNYSYPYLGLLTTEISQWLDLTVLSHLEFARAHLHLCISDVLLQEFQDAEDYDHSGETWMGTTTVNFRRKDTKEGAFV
ncbi:uncharacterized protein N7483_009111 [Penicillium malachiteum]|uniref:uncharacterized protein n=1 Tax=Penicillium malachiteum TaxID=1324776 RepID=UPI0025477CE7|nr:uncharacterized protein N7483_009111 [Penicillium malachiteum]KAJ5721177.1 hypothetical protein N7483_009111 [Penicillium malachiteum]